MKLTLLKPGEHWRNVDCKSGWVIKNIIENNFFYNMFTLNSIFPNSCETKYFYKKILNKKWIKV